MEADEPNKPGRWIAWVEGQAPNGTPLRRSFTFFALPQKLESTYSPDLTVAFPNFPGADAPQTWKEHQHEFDRAATQLLPRSLLDNELGAILVAGIAEAEPLGRERRFVESTSVVNADRHVALKLKLQNLQDMARPSLENSNGTHRPILKINLSHTDLSAKNTLAHLHNSQLQIACLTRIGPQNDCRYITYRLRRLPSRLPSI